MLPTKALSAEVPRCLALKVIVEIDPATDGMRREPLWSTLAAVGGDVLDAMFSVSSYPVAEAASGSSPLSRFTKCI